MAHNLEIINNEASMFYYGDTPWHKLGKQVNRPLTAAEALTEAKLEYTVIGNPVFCNKRFGNTMMLTAIPNVKANVREDTQDVIGIVSDRYKIIQNKECFSYLDPIVGEYGAVYHTAGVLGRGERIWIMAKLPESVKVGDDVIDQHLVITNSHDGTDSFKVYFTPIRVVCENTLNASIEGAKKCYSIKHIGNTIKKMDEIRDIMFSNNKYIKGLTTKLERFMDVHIDKVQYNKFTDTIFGEDKDLSSRGLKIKQEFNEIMFYGRGQNITETHSITAYQLYNGAVLYADTKKYRNTHTTFNNVLRNDGLKQKAFNYCNSLIN